jgi:hypothetical protein
MNPLIKVGVCVAYDWHLLQFAIPLFYNDADRIVLSVDKDRISWANQIFDFDERKFTTMIKELDPGKKITIVAENFHQFSSPMENEVYQRNYMATVLEKGGWHIQLDCDEYFLEFPAFVKFLKKLDESRSGLANICCPLVTLYKQIPEGYLYIDASPGTREYIQIASRNPEYIYGRRNGHFNIYTNFLILHQSWARTEHEVIQKLKNWGHKNDFDGVKYLNQWKSVDRTNYENLKNFHPIQADVWRGLRLLEGSTLEECLKNISTIQFKPLSSLSLAIRNSKTLSRVRHLLNRFK